MTAEQIAVVLRKMTPVIETVAGCTLRIRDESDRDEARIERALAGHYPGDRRALEANFNRWFVIAADVP